MKLAIGVMAKAPVAGHCKTRLAAALGAQLAADLCEAMLRDTLDAIAKSIRATRYVVLAAPEHDGARLLATIAPSPWEVVVQQGADLGIRLAHAAQALAEDGSAVALVDADSPTAPWDVAGEALARLAPGRACLGPCVDGGYWLIGLAEPARRVFEDVVWSTPTVADTTRARIAEVGLVLEEVPAAFDVDELADLTRLRAAATSATAPRTAAWLAQRGPV